MDNTRKPRSLEELDASLRVLRSGSSASDEPKKNGVSADGAGMGLGFRIASELVAGILVGGFLGWSIDRWLETKPWFMVVFVFMGAAAGVMNAYRAARNLDDAVGMEMSKRRKSSGDGVRE